MPSQSRARSQTHFMLSRSRARSHTFYAITVQSKVTNLCHHSLEQGHKVMPLQSRARSQTCYHSLEQDHKPILCHHSPEKVTDILCHYSPEQGHRHFMPLQSRASHRLLCHHSPEQGHRHILCHHSPEQGHMFMPPVQSKVTMSSQSRARSQIHAVILQSKVTDTFYTITVQIIVIFTLYTYQD